MINVKEIVFAKQLKRYLNVDKYEFGKCDVCRKEMALKNGICAECKDKTELPDCFKQIFGGFNDKKSN